MMCIMLVVETVLQLKGLAMTVKQANKVLRSYGIKTTSDLDRWIRDNPRVDRFGGKYLLSRFAALKECVGENAATSMLHELSIQQCCKAI